VSAFAGDAGESADAAVARAAAIAVMASFMNRNPTRAALRNLR
jgi:hypothetical protein